jgi:Trk K+ transport system NAD-binding subunit
MNKNNDLHNIYKSRRILILGCGYMGIDVALRLSEAGNIVKIMDSDPNTFSRIPKNMIDSNRIQPILGDGVFEDDIRRASGQKLDVFIAATGITSVNIMSSQKAMHLVKIPKVICVVDDEDVEEIYSQMGLQILNRRKLAVEHILMDALDQK